MLEIQKETIAAPPALIQELPTRHALSRRRVLQVGGGLVLVVAGDTLFRAYDQGVFSTGEGAAYDALQARRIQRVEHALQLGMGQRPYQVDHRTAGHRRMEAKMASAWSAGPV
jgi:hypothetical protein